MDDAPTLLENRQRPGTTGRRSESRRRPEPIRIGATAKVTPASKKQIREIRSGGSYLSQSDLRALLRSG